MNFRIHFCWAVMAFMLAIVAVASTQAQQIKWQKQDAGTDASFRGLAVVDANTAWASGSQGTVLRTTDGGKTWNNVAVPDGDKFDFRDIHAFDAKSAIVLNAGTPGVIYRTTDAGKNWTRVYNDTRKEIFFDAMDFWDDENGIAFGDPIDGRLVIIRTEDGGKSWQELDRSRQPQMQTGEAGFAASGSCLITSGKKTVWIGTGGHEQEKSADHSRLLVSRDRGETWSSVKVPIPRNSSSGIFSLCFIDEKNGVAVGGDYTQPDSTKNNVAVTSDGGKTWSIPNDAKPSKIKTPSGFRSVVIGFEIDSKPIFMAAGTNGADVSYDQGGTWQQSTDISLNVTGVSRGKNPVIYFAGPRGIVGVAKISAHE